MSKTIRIKLYKFEELTPAAQSKALTQFAGINVDYEWWDSTYEDAKHIGLTITGFDIDRGSYCKGLFTNSAEECAHKIEKEHGEKCTTYATAINYLANRDTIMLVAPKDEFGEFGDEYALESDLDELDAEFLKSLCEDYRIILSKEYDYLTSEEAVKETIIANGYDFAKDGKQYC